MLERCGLMVRLAAAAVLKAGAAIAAEPPPTGMARGLYAWFEGALIERCGPAPGMSRPIADIIALSSAERPGMVMLRVSTLIQ